MSTTALFYEGRNSRDLERFGAVACAADTAGRKPLADFLNDTWTKFGSEYGTNLFKRVTMADVRAAREDLRRANTKRQQ